MKCMTDRSVVRANTSEHLITGLIYCGKCGAKMRYQKWGNKGAQLVCYSQQKSKPYLIKDENCDQEKVWADEVEDIVIKSIFQFADNYKPSKTESIVQENTLSLLYEQQNSLSKKLKKLYTIYSESDEDEDNDVLLETISDLKKQITNLNKNIELETKNNIVFNRRKERVEILSTVKDLWNSLDSTQRKTIVRKLINKITITDSHVHIDFSI